MSPSGQGLGAVVLVALMLIHAGDALKCFSCSSDTDSRCKDYFDNSQHALKDCEVDRYGHTNMEPYCKKLVHSVDQYSKQKEIIRSCAWASPGDPQSICRDSTHNLLYQHHCSVCKTDACNGGPGPALPATAACLLPALVALLLAAV